MMDKVDYRFLGNIDKEKAEAEKAARAFKNMVDAYTEVGFSRGEAIAIVLELSAAALSRERKENTDNG